MKLTIEIEKWGENEFDVTVNGTRHFILPTIDEVLMRVSETLLEEEDTKIPF